uniref:Uncharacterized protein n=1 Tax=Arundo donax TaxID=35708 RepID=A0A0A9BFC5_ARUDO
MGICMSPHGCPAGMSIRWSVTKSVAANY